MDLVHSKAWYSEKKKGSLTVWCVLTLLPGAVLFLSLLMVCRYRIERNDAGRMTHLSGKAALSFYDGPLCERYGLYGTPSSEIEEKVLFFLEQNRNQDHHYLFRNPIYLLDPARPFPSFFHYEIQELRIDAGHSLRNPDAFMKQVKEVMNYRVLGEVISFLSSQLQEIGKTQSQNGGLEASFALIQQELTQYQQLYHLLTQMLYSDTFQIGVDSITANKSADPQRIAELLTSTDSRSELERTELRNRLKWWQEHCDVLLAKNQYAIQYCTQLEGVVQGLQKEITAFQQLAGKLSDEEREQDQKKNMIQSIAKLKNELWGTKGETAALIRKLNDNMALLTPLEGKLLPVLQELSTLTELKTSDCFALKSVFLQFSGYTGSFDMKKTEKGNSLLDFLGASDWLKQYYVDLSVYAPNQDLLEGEEDSFSFLNPFYIQQQISLQMDFFQPQTWGERVEDHVFLCEYGVSAFRNLSDTVQEEEGSWPRDFRGKPFGSTILRNETEFLIHGSWNEYQNVSDVQIKILALRTIMNMAFLFSDPEKSAVLHSLADPANLVIPVIGGVVIYTAAALLWGAAEAYLDFSALIQGAAVPLWKTRETWQSDLKGILKKSASAMKLRPEKEDKEKSKMEKILSMDYEMYLRLLMLFTSREVLIDRMQRLIDLNLRKEGNPLFSLSNMVMDFSMTAEIRGQYGSYEQYEMFSYYPE